MTPLFSRAACVSAIAVAVIVAGGAWGVHAQTPDQQQVDSGSAPPFAALAQQTAPTEPPGHLTGVDGAVVIERANQGDEAVAGMPVLIGDRLRADSGQAEVMWAQGAMLSLARYTEVDVVAPSTIRLPRGRLTVTIKNIPGQVVNEQLWIDAPGASVRFFTAGVYRIAVTGDDEPDVTLGVTNGSAQLVSERGMVAIADGEQSSVRGGGLPSQPERFLASAEDSTYDPSADVATFQRGDTGDAYGAAGYAETGATGYGNYLPQNLYGYESVLNSSGSWGTVPTYGVVWFPRVGHDWRPYYHGRWSYIPRYGWTWAGTDRFAWPTQYYGRWGVTQAGAWYWIPSNKWGPAWVAWTVAPDYVGWCPLGWDGRPVYAFSAGFGPGFHTTETFRAWTVIGANHLGGDVPRSVVDRNVLLRDRPAFVTQYVAPRAPTYIVKDGNRAYVYRGTGDTITSSGTGTRTRAAVTRTRGVNADATPGTATTRRGNQNANQNGTQGLTPNAPPIPTTGAAGIPTTGAAGIPTSGGAVQRHSNNPGRPDGMSQPDHRDFGGSNGRSTVAPVLEKDSNGVLRPPSGMSGPPGVYAPPRSTAAPPASNNSGGSQQQQQQQQSQQSQQSNQSQSRQSSGSSGRSSSSNGSGSSNGSSSSNSSDSKDNGSNGKSSSGATRRNP